MRHKLSEKDKRVLTTCELFEGIEPSALCDVLNGLDARIEEFDRGETIIAEGDEVREMGVVLDGVISAGFVNVDGTETNLYFIRAGMQFGAHASCARDPRSRMLLYARVPTRCLRFDIRHLIGRCDLKPWEQKLMSNLLRTGAERTLDLYQKVHIYGQRRVRGRLKLFLMALPREDDVVTLTDSRTRVAEYLNVDRSALARELTAMEKEGLVRIDDRRIRLLDRDFFQLDRK